MLQNFGHFWGFLAIFPDFGHFWPKKAQIIGRLNGKWLFLAKKANNWAFERENWDFARTRHPGPLKIAF